MIYDFIKIVDIVTQIKSFKLNKINLTIRNHSAAV